MLLVHQDVTIPRLAIFEVDKDLVGILQWPLLHPRLDLLVGRKLKHLFDLMRRADSAAANLDTAGDQRESVHRRQVTTIRSSERTVSILSRLHGGMEDEPDLNQTALRLEQTQIIRQRHLLA
jgi:hypothetical protein